MTSKHIAYHRLFNQGIVGSHFTAPDEVVRWMGCIQAQDYGDAKWAIGNRLSGTTEAGIDKDFNAGKILRTHILRPVWHLVTPEDIGWLLRLTAPRIQAFNKGLYRQLGIDDITLRRSKHVIGNALAGGQQFTREQLLRSLKKGRVETDAIRLSFLLMDAELDGLICSGKRQGRSFTYALLEERAPGIPHIDQEEAIAQLTMRYFASRGPATLLDLCWWSGLQLPQARIGIELNKQRLDHVVVDGEAYWFVEMGARGIVAPGDAGVVEMDRVEGVNGAGGMNGAVGVHLLPAFDEYAVGYRDRSAILEPAYQKRSGNGLFKPAIVIDGQIAGTWKQRIVKGKMLVDIDPFTETDPVSTGQIREAARQYARFIGKESAEVIVAI